MNQSAISKETKAGPHLHHKTRPADSSRLPNRRQKRSRAFTPTIIAQVARLWKKMAFDARMSTNNE